MGNTIFKVVLEHLSLFSFIYFFAQGLPLLLCKECAKIFDVKVFNNNLSDRYGGKVAILDRRIIFLEFPFFCIAMAAALRRTMMMK